MMPTNYPVFGDDPVCFKEDQKFYFSKALLTCHAMLVLTLKLLFLCHLRSINKEDLFKQITKRQ